MQALPPLRPRLSGITGHLRRFSSWKLLPVRAFSSSWDISNQSRGGLPRFFSEVLPPSEGVVERVQGDEFFHMTRVLRLTTNDRVELFNGKGGLVSGRIQSIDRAGLDFVALEELKSINPQSLRWHVLAAFGTLKGGRADWLVEKCAELGASSVTPLLTERSPSISENRVDRLERVILAASKQCQRLHEMVVHPPTKVSDVIHRISQTKLSFLAVAEAPPLINVLTSSAIDTDGLIIIGPEGDFTEKKLELLADAGATAIGLGPNRLRVETATIALLATVMLWSDAQQKTALI